MSRICYYVRTSERALETLGADPEAIFGDLSGLPPGTEVIDIDKAYEALAWLTSPRKRAEARHMTRLINEPDWAVADVRASVAMLEDMATDDALAALEGRSEERAPEIDLGMGGAAIFRSARVAQLESAIGRLDEHVLRHNLDLTAMDADDVQPGYWQEEGEDTFQSYLLPALVRLKAFYAAASNQNQIVLVLWC